MPTLSNIGGELDLQIGQNTDFGPVSLTFTNPDGTPTDLTGCSLASAITRAQTYGPLVAAFEVTITDAAAGLALMFMPAATTAQIPCGANPNDPSYMYVWDLKLTDSGGDITRPLWGRALVQRQVTP